MTKNEKIKIGVQGLPGAFHEVAANQFFRRIFKGENEIQMVNFETFEMIYDALNKNEINYAVVAFENSLMGSIYKNFDLIVQHDFEIIGETYVHIHHQLLGTKDAIISDIKEVYSQAPALAQVEHTLNDILPNVKKVEYFDTAASAKMVADKNDKSIASVASKRAGDIYGLKVLKKDIEDDKENWTRFIVITKKGQKIASLFSAPQKIKTKYKTTLVFTGKSEEVGFLFKCLACFSLRNINLTKIESRPIPKQPWKYYFYIDLLGSMEDEKVKNAINNLREICTMVKILGSYEMEEMK